MVFEELLVWLTSIEGGAFIVVLWATSWGLEEFQAWQKLHSKVKALVVLAIAIVVTIGATAISRNPELVAAVSPWATPVIYTMLAWLATQTVHKIDVGRKAKET